MITDIPNPDVAISMGCNVSCPFIGRAFDDNWGLEDPTGKTDEAFAIYLIIDFLLIFLYCAIWFILWKKNNVFRALALSIIPSVIFLFSGIMSRSILLIFATILFAPAHILISYKNAK